MNWLGFFFFFSCIHVGDTTMSGIQSSHRDTREEKYSVDEETNGIYALLSLSAAGQQHGGHEGSPEKAGLGKRKRSHGAMSSSGVARSSTDIGSPHRRDMGQMRLPAWLVHIQKVMERVTSGRPRDGRHRDEHGTSLSFMTREFFYSEIDRSWFLEDGGMTRMLENLGLLTHGMPQSPGVLLHRHEWWALLSLIGSDNKKPRRLSESFLYESRVALQCHRDRTKIPFVVGQRVTARHPVSRELHDGVILTLSKDACRVQFDRVDLGVHLVRTCDIAKTFSPPPMMVHDGAMPFVIPPLHYFVQHYVQSNSNTPSPEKGKPDDRKNIVCDEKGDMIHTMGEKERRQQVLDMVQDMLQRAYQQHDADVLERSADSLFESCARLIEENKTNATCLLRATEAHQTVGQEPSLGMQSGGLRDHVHRVLQKGLSDRIREYVKVLLVLSRFPDTFDMMMHIVHRLVNLDSTPVPQQ